MPDQSLSASPAKRKVELEDLYRFRLLSDPQASPDGRTVAYVQTRLRKKKNDYGSNIWLVPAEGGEPLKLTASGGRDFSPRWSPSGDEIAFISTRSGKAQIWIIRTGGGEARQLTYLKRGVEDLAWSPDGKWIAFVSKADSDGVRNSEEEEARDGRDIDSENREPGSATADLAAPVRAAGEWDEDEEDEAGDDEKGDHAKAVTRMHYKADGAGLLERRRHLFIVRSKGGKPRQLTDGDWDVGAVRWSPGGESIAFLSNQEPDADFRNIQDVFVLPVDEEGNVGDMRRITNHDMAISNVDWRPSGAGFVIFAHTRLDEGALATNPQVWTLSMDGAVRNLTEGFDRPVGSWISGDMRAGTGEARARFSPDGETTYFLVTTDGNVHVYSVPLVGGEVRQVVGGERQVLNFALVEGGIVFAASTPHNPNDLFHAAFDGAGEQRLTGVNADILGSLELGKLQDFWIERPSGTSIHGWTLLPPDYREGEKYPLVLEIHGGPHMSYGNVYIHEFQLLAARGFIVLYTNPRGSQGYGQAYADAIRNDWGGIDYEDIMACVDHAVAQGNVDEQRMGVGGGSYGGYMTTWIIGHTDRFKAAVASRMVSNLYSAWGSGDFTWMLWSWELEGTPQERTQLYLERSPVTYVEEMRTPLLITHAEDDLRTAIEQSEQVYVALKLRKREVKMVRLPSGGHDVSRTGKPSLRVERLRYILEWYEQYLLGR